MKKIKGFTLIEMLFVMALIMLISMAAIQENMRETRHAQAKKLGRDLQQYNAAVRSYIASRGTASVGTRSGVNWLKHGATCPGGTAPDAFLPCAFPATTMFNKTFTTRIVNSGDITGTTTLSRIIVGTTVRRDLAGLATQTASSADQVNGVPVGADTYSVDGAGNIVATASNNASLDIWLRRDGSNNMTGNLNMGGNDISNSRYMYANDVRSTTQGRWLSQGVNTKMLAEQGTVVQKPTCVQPGSVPQIFVAPALFSSGASGEPINAVQAWATNLGSSWRINIRVLVASGWKQAASSYRQAEVSVKCS